MSNIPTRPVAKSSPGRLYCLAICLSAAPDEQRRAEEIFQLQFDFFLFPQIVILFSILDFLHLSPDPPRREGEYVGAGNEKNEAEK